MVEHINKLRIDLVTAEQQEYEEGKDVDDMMKRLMDKNTSKDGNELDGGESSLLIDLNENILREETTFNDSQLSDQMKRSNIDGKNDDKLQSKQKKVGEKDALVSYVETQEEKPLISPI